MSFKKLPNRTQRKIQERMFEVVLSEISDGTSSKKEISNIINWYNDNFDYKNNELSDLFAIKYQKIEPEIRKEIVMFDNGEYSKFAIEYIKGKYRKVESYNTQINLYKTHINPFELRLKKPIWSFEEKELREYFEDIDSSSSNLKRSIYSFVKNYTGWVIDKKKAIDVNNAKKLNIRELLVVDSNTLTNGLYGLESFNDKIEELAKETGIQNVIIFVMARYGIMGNDLEDALSLRISDITECKANIFKNGELITSVPIDDNFKKWCRMADSVKINADIKVGTIVKNILNGNSEKISNNTVYTRIKYSKADFRLRDLYRSRVFDLVLEKRKTRKITTIDIQKVLWTLDPSSSRGKSHSFKVWYENLTGDKVYMANTDYKMLVDKNAKTFVKELRDKLNYY